MPFNSTGPHYCPECPPTYRYPKGKPRVRDGIRLEEFESNYSGLGVDLAECPSCHCTFAVSYKLDKITKQTGPHGEKLSE